jgi:toxin ParE1/3/4
LRALDLALLAEADLASIFRHSGEVFGAQALRRYEAVVDIALEDLRADPCCLGSLDRPEFGPGTRTYHLRHCRTRARGRGGRIANPRHLLVYEFDDERVLVMRVLHDAMDLARHLPAEP